MPNARPTVVLIHGLWMTPRSWEGWKDRYERAGHRVLAPSWPGMERGVEAIRRDPTPLRGLGLKKITDHYERIIRGLDEPPIIMGHSLGGLVTQLLVDRGLGCSAVPIAPGQTAGVLILPWSAIRSGFSVLGNPFNYNRAVPLSPRQFNWAFANELDPVASREEYDRQCVPAAGRALWDAALSLGNPYAVTKVNYKNGNRAPMLYIAGELDRVVPPSVPRATIKKYAGSGSFIEYKEYPGRTHHIVGQDGWEEVADYALEWAVRHARGRSLPQDPVRDPRRSPALTA